MPDLHPSSWGSGLQMVVQSINEYAEVGGTEWAALSEADGWLNMIDFYVLQVWVEQGIVRVFQNTKSANRSHTAALPSVFKLQPRDSIVQRRHVGHVGGITELLYNSVTMWMPVAWR